MDSRRDKGLAQAEIARNQRSCPSLPRLEQTVFALRRVERLKSPEGTWDTSRFSQRALPREAGHSDSTLPSAAFNCRPPPVPQVPMAPEALYTRVNACAHRWLAGCPKSILPPP